MKSLREQMLKAGLVNKKKVKKIEHEKRIKRKEITASEREQIEKKKKEEWQKKQAAQKEEQRRKAELQKQAATKKEFQNTVINVIQQNALKQIKGGNRKFYFVTPEKKISSFKLADDLVRKLEKGTLAIVSDTTEQNEPYVIVPQSAAKKIAELKPECLLFFYPDHGIV